MTKLSRLIRNLFEFRGMSVRRVSRLGSYRNLQLLVFPTNYDSPKEHTYARSGPLPLNSCLAVLPD